MKNNTSTPPARFHLPILYKSGFSVSLIIMLSYLSLIGQQTSLPCNSYSPWVPSTFTVEESHSSPLLACWEGDILCGGTNFPANVVNSNTSDFATGHITGVGSLILSVKDNTNNYTAGNFAGFVVSSGLFSLGLFSSIKITTYLEDVQQEDYQAVDLIGLSSGFLSGPIQIGFVTTVNYDEIEITIDNLLGIGSYNVYYAVNEKFCDGPDLACNEETRLNQPTFPVTIDYAKTGTSGASVAVVDNPEAAISASTTDFASLIHVASVLGQSFLTVEEQVTDYPAGTFVGFDIENLTLVSVDVLNYITITSYLNGVQQQVVSGPGLLAGVPLLTSSGRYTVGFVTTTSVDKIKITVQQPVGVTLGTTRVYSAIFRAFCEGNEPDCNVNTILTSPDYPVLIDIAQTGLTGAVCVGCSIIEPGNVIDNNSTTYAQIIITAGVLTTGSLAVKDQLTDYPAGTFAGFRIENPNLVDANALNGITVSTYLNGSLQESETNVGALVSVGSDLLVNDDQQVVGFVTNLPFDEVKISLNNVGSFNIGTTRIHELVITAFCPTDIACDTTYFLNVPEFPVYIDAFRTGIDGAVCALCSVTGEENVISLSNTDYGLITVVANVLSSGSIAVRDALYTYPQGTYAGFVIEDLGLLLEAELFNTITISTFNNGVFQESKSGSDLLDVALIILFISDAPGRYNVGFKTTLPFDEVRITVGSLVAAINLVRVYGAFVDTRASNGGDLFCNDAPLANPDLVATDEDSSIIIDVLANDNDTDDATGIPTVTDGPDHGMVTVNADSTITYTPDPDFVGTDVFIYTICDPQSLCDTALVTVMVQPQLDTLIYTIPEDNTQQVCIDDLPTVFSDPATSISICGVPSHGSAMILGTCVDYDPDANFTGQDMFCVYVCHPDIPTLCDTTIIIINLTPVNDPPDAHPDVVTTPEDMPVVITVLANDSDPDNPLGTPTISDPPDHGMVTVNGDGTITYTPDPNYFGPDAFIYTICDPEPLCDTAIVMINITPVNDGPLAQPDDEVTPEDMPVIITVFANDSDPDNPLGTPTISDPPDHGMVTVNAGGTITYTPGPDYVGSDTFIYTLCDPQPLCDTALVTVFVSPQIDTVNYTIPEDGMQQACADDLTTFSEPATSISACDLPSHGSVMISGTCVTYTPNSGFNGMDTFCVYVCHPDIPSLCDTTIIIINVTPFNNPPAAHPDAATTPEDMSVIINVLANDNDPDDPLGTPTISDPPDHGMVIVNAGGTITYTPNSNYFGPDNFIYMICDPGPLCDTAIVMINVTPVNDAPVAQPDAATTPEDMSVIITVLANDSDPDNPLGTPSVTTSPTHGMVVVNAGGTITYTPNPNYFGPDQFIYTLCDPQPLCDTALVKITVSPVNDAPLANPDVSTTPEDMSVIITVLANDSDPDNPLGTPSVTTSPTHGMVVVNVGGTITYTPNPNYFGPDQFIYTLCDPQPLCDTALVKITVSPVNDAPLANPDVATTPEDMSVIITVLANDSDPDNALGTPSVTTPPTHGMVVVNAGGTITYTPNPNYFGPDQFIYTLCDPQPLCDTALVKITVSPVNDAPLANPDVATTPEDMSVIITVLANDSDPDNALGTPSVTTPPTHGMVVVNAGGTITYTPNPNYFGPDQFIYTLCDPQPLCDTALVKITVSSVNDAPLANPDVATTPEDMSIIITVLANDSDADNPLGTPSVTSPPTHGMVVVNAGGTITYTPNPNYFGPDQFIYTLCDPQPLCDTALVKITVSPVNDAPVANPDVATTVQEMSVIINVLANDSDPDNPLGTPTIPDPPDHGMVTVNAGGSITYTPNPGFTGMDSFIYMLCDPQPLCDTAIVHLTVTPVIIQELGIGCPSDLVLECGSADYVGQINSWIATATASGGCGGPITITTNYDGSSVPMLSCNLSTGLLITFTATDTCGNSGTCTSTVYLDDSLAPLVISGDIDTCYNTMNEAIAAAMAATTVSDNCSLSDDLTIDVDVSAGPFCDSTITLTVTDLCGNAATATYQTMINCQTIRLKVYLEGPYSTTGDSMQTTMNSLHTLPGQLNASPFIFDAPPGQPYQVAPWNYTGNLGLNFGDGAGMTPYPPDVVDWILVTVRHNGIMPANNIWTCAGWIHKDGTVTFPENCPGPTINIGDDYYFLVQHHNHLGILSASFVNILCNGSVLEWDFRTSDSYKPVFRFGQKQVEFGVWAMFQGNGEQIQSIGSINSIDRTLWKSNQGYEGYNSGDYNLNAATNSVDETNWKINQNKTTGVVFY